MSVLKIEEEEKKKRMSFLETYFFFQYTLPPNINTGSTLSLTDAQVY